VNWIQQAPDRIQYGVVVKLRVTTNWDDSDQLADHQQFKKCQGSIWPQSPPWSGVQSIALLFGVGYDAISG